MTDVAKYDDLVARVRERAADPERRVDDRPSELFASMSSAGLGELMRLGRSLAGDLQRLVRSGPDDEVVRRSEELRRQMETPAGRALPPAASAEEIAAAEARLGITAPPLLRRLYTEVAHGGFGPGPGLVGFHGGATTDKGKSIEDMYAEMLDATSENARWVWPRELLPVSDLGGVYVCVDTSSSAGHVVEFDFEELDDDGADGGWSRAFSERAPSLDAWLESWLGSTPEPFGQFAIGPQSEMTFDLAEETRRYWASMTPEERAEYGLPEKGWGRVLFGEAWGDDPRDGSRD